MSNWTQVAACHPDITELFDRVTHSMGSMRQAAFAELCGVLTSRVSELSDEIDAELAELGVLDIESTQFETRFDALRRRVIDELAATSPPHSRTADESSDPLRQHPQDPAEGIDVRQAGEAAQREHPEEAAEG